MALFSFGLGFYGLTVYVAMLQRLYGWSASAVSAPVTVYYVAGALLTAVIAGVYERFGPARRRGGRRVAMAAGVAMLGIVSRPWQLYPVFLVMSVGWGAMSGAAINIILAPWCERRRGLAVSLAFNGATLGGVIVVPALIPLIDALGFARALAVAALVQLVVMLAIAAGDPATRPRRARRRARRRAPWRRDRRARRVAPSLATATRSARGASGACQRPSRSASRLRSACSRTWSRS